eukprot:TRINITY_DN66970_c9_g1_i3.p1 TRINITY_DN66970_c9_g1~~TRINITY_DN66970_c9_g1_i3.p1  ORF type:complete len:313 (-),score=6.21 TRINITY_DN66970_c9_g1_i3:290-1168(-)
MPISSAAFYGEYYGHTIAHLKTLYETLRGQRAPTDRFIWLAGDSSLDNKHWIWRNKKRDAVNGYEDVLNPPASTPDVAYHLNVLGEGKACTVNCAREESTIGARHGGKLLPQDEFIRDNISANDVLVVSVGGNDIALKPTGWTIWNMLLMVTLNSVARINRGPSAAWGMRYFQRMFRDDVTQYIETLISKQKPAQVLICMIYYPDEKQTGSWADRVLGPLGYNSNPQKLQAAISQIYKHATSEISIEGTTVTPVAFFDVLDGKNTEDYVDRVEPSDSGGFKMARLIWDNILQ